MTFLEWLYGSGVGFTNPKIEGQWGPLHIVVLILGIALMVALSLIFRNKDEKTKRNVIFVIAGILLFFEIARRIVNLTSPITFDHHNLLWVLLPRPGCAISVWLIILAPFINKKGFYNIASIVSILCATIFFAYPEAGFNNEYILFENVYSIVTHTGFYIGAVLITSLGLANYDYKDCKLDLITLGGVILYSAIEMFILKDLNGNPVEKDPFYILEGNEVQEIIGIDSYPLYFILYIAFIVVYVSAYYLISEFTVNKNRSLD